MVPCRIMLFRVEKDCFKLINNNDIALEIWSEVHYFIPNTMFAYERNALRGHKFG